MFNRHVHTGSGSFLVRPDSIAGYTFQAENYRPENLVEVLIRAGVASPAARDMDAEEVLDQIASANGIDRTDQYSFDSDDFPKIVFSDQLCEEDRYWYGDIG